MGSRLLEIQEEKEQAATEILLKSKLLKRCECCDDIYTTDYSVTEETYKIANFLFTKEDPLVSCFRDRTEMTDTIDNVFSNTLEECHCSYIANKDD